MKPRKTCNLRNYNLSTFYCLNCGQPGIPIMRQIGHERGKLHRKKLYCPHCKMTINHVECRTDADVFEFKEAFLNGEFKDEAQESLDYVRTERQWKKHLVSIGRRTN